MLDESLAHFPSTAKILRTDEQGPEVYCVTLKEPCLALVVHGCREHDGVGLQVGPRVARGVLSTVHPCVHPTVAQTQQRSRDATIERRPSRIFITQKKSNKIT
jgi:hypothetical protein